MHHLAFPQISPLVSFAASASPSQDDEAGYRAGYLRRTDHEFVHMLNSFRCSGGLSRLKEVAILCENRGGLDIPSLSACLSRKEIICFEWRSEAWLPLFQFDPLGMMLRPQIQPVVSELSCIYGPWDLAYWFSQPNPWLADRTPADCVLSDLSTVLQAARADRFIAS